MTKLYKWFVWSSKLSRYVAIPGLFPDCRGDFPAIIVDIPFGVPIPPMFSIPFLN